MPETAVYENRGPVFWQNDIGAARQVLRMKPKPKACAVQQRAKPQFRTSVPTPDPRHVPAPPLGGERVHHHRPSGMGLSASAVIFSIGNTLFDAVVLPAWQYGVVGTSMRKTCWETPACKPPDLRPGISAKPCLIGLNDDHAARYEMLSSWPLASCLSREITAPAKSRTRHPKPAAIYLSVLPESPAPNSCKLNPGDEVRGTVGPRLSQGIEAQCVARSLN